MSDIALSLGEKGRAVFMPEILSRIAAIALDKTKGRLFACDGALEGLREKIGRFAKGIRIEQGEDSVKIAVRAEVKYGEDMAKAAAEAQEAVKEAIEIMTGICVSEVNVHICAVRLTEETA